MPEMVTAFCSLKRVGAYDRNSMITEVFAVKRLALSSLKHANIASSHFILPDLFDGGWMHVVLELLGASIYMYGKLRILLDKEDSM